MNQKLNITSLQTRRDRLYSGRKISKSEIQKDCSDTSMHDKLCIKSLNLYGRKIINIKWYKVLYRIDTSITGSS
jgi:hypothetical protein